MHTFAIVAVRLIGLWIIASSLSGLGTLAVVLTQPVPPQRVLGPYWPHMLTTALATPIAGVLLLALSRPIAALVVRGVAEETPAPEAPTVRAFAQLGIFLLGLFALLQGLPFVVQSFFEERPLGPHYWLYSGFGLILLLVSLPLGRWIAQLRR